MVPADTASLDNQTMPGEGSIFRLNVSGCKWRSKCAGNGVLIKPNQAGTLTEVFSAVEYAKRAGYAIILSHRLGDSEDTFLADLAVAANTGYIKTGAVCRAERTAKYNRLIKIEDKLDGGAAYGS